MQKKYAIHPQCIASKTDGDIHFIGYTQLIRLYRVNPAECILWSSLSIEQSKNIIHLYPRFNGNYRLKEV